MKSIVLLSHCLLNPFSKVKNNKEPDDVSALIEWLMKNKIGIIQLKCPETEMYGLKRWGHVREQFDTPHYRHVSRTLISQTIDEVKEYIRNGYKLSAVIGIDGSPSCGVHCSCSSKRWGGEISIIQDLEEVKQIDYCNLPGIFMEELQMQLEHNGIQTAFLAYKGKALDALIKEAELLIRSV